MRRSNYDNYRANISQVSNCLNNVPVVNNYCASESRTTGMSWANKYQRPIMTSRVARRRFDPDDESSMRILQNNNCSVVSPRSYTHTDWSTAPIGVVWIFPDTNVSAVQATVSRDEHAIIASFRHHLRVVEALERRHVWRFIKRYLYFPVHAAQSRNTTRPRISVRSFVRQTAADGAAAAASSRAAVEQKGHQQQRRYSAPACGWQQQQQKLRIAAAAAAVVAQQQQLWMKQSVAAAAVGQLPPAATGGGQNDSAVDQLNISRRQCQSKHGNCRCDADNGVSIQSPARPD